MNGATALDCAKIIRIPNAMKMTTIGTSQNFFSWRRNWKNSVMTRFLFMMASEHPLEMRAIAIPSGIGRPTVEPCPAAAERILAGETPDERHRNEHHGE